MSIPSIKRTNRTTTFEILIIINEEKTTKVIGTKHATFDSKTGISLQKRSLKGKIGDINYKIRF